MTKSGMKDQEFRQDFDDLITYINPSEDCKTFRLWSLNFTIYNLHHFAGTINAEVIYEGYYGIMVLA